MYTKIPSNGGVLTIFLSLKMIVLWWSFPVNPESPRSISLACLAQSSRRLFSAKDLWVDWADSKPALPGRERSHIPPNRKRKIIDSKWQLGGDIVSSRELYLICKLCILHKLNPFQPYISLYNLECLSQIIQKANRTMPERNSKTIDYGR